MIDRINEGTGGKEKVLGLEMAILHGKVSNSYVKSYLMQANLLHLLGKLGDHRAALSILVHDLRDATSAEAYCTLGGEVVPGKTAQAIGEKCGLQLWSGALFSSLMDKKGQVVGVGAMERQKSVDEGVKKGLLKVLLEVYMNDGCVTSPSPIFPEVMTS